MKIALLGHAIGNIGHKFMAMGVMEVLRDAFGPQAADLFQQHQPLGVYRSPFFKILDAQPLRKIPFFRHLLGTETAMRLFWPRAAHLKHYQLALLCGGPNLVPGVAASGEMRLIFHHQAGAFTFHGVPVLDLAVGAGGLGLEKAEGLTNPQEAFSEADARFYRKTLSLNAGTTARDHVAQSLLRGWGREAPLIPCAAILSGREFLRLAKDASGKDSCVIINFQRVGANEDWGQNVDPDQWKETIALLAASLAKRHKVEFLCHNEVEARLVSQHFPGYPAHMPTTLIDYAGVISRAKVGLVSRLHAALPLAGMGIPAVVIGTDVRLFAADLIGLPTCYVKRARADALEAQMEDIMAAAPAWREKLQATREQAAREYVDYITSFMGRRP